MMYGVDILVVEEGCKETDKIHGRMCKKYWEFRDLRLMGWLNWS
jgi:hypothetical protein